MNENDANPIVQLPLVCTRGVVVFPNQEVIIDVGREKSTRAVEEAQEKIRKSGRSGSTAGSGTGRA